MKKAEIRLILNELLEPLAAIEHERWSRWQQYVHSKGALQPDGSLVISADLIRHWEKQIATPYHMLSEPEKDDDRKQVREYLPLIAEALEKAV